MLTNDIDEIGPGQGQYTLMCEDDGGVIDDLIAYALADRFLLVVNASNVAACRDRLADRLPEGVALADRLLEVAMMALQGPAWKEALSPHLATPLALSLDYFEVGEDMVAGVPCLIARTGYTGEPGVELMCPWDGAPPSGTRSCRATTRPSPPAWSRATPCALRWATRSTGRSSRGRTPIEAGLRWACDVDGGRFFGAERMRRQAAEGTPERLAIFRLTEPGIPRPGQDVLVEGSPAGTVTSGTLSPTLDVGIGMAYVPRAGGRARTTTSSSTSAVSRRPPAPPAARWWPRPRGNEGDP